MRVASLGWAKPDSTRQCPVAVGSPWALAGVIAFPVYAQGTISAKQSEVMNKLLAGYAEEAKVEVKAEKGRGTASDKPFTAENGRKFYLVRRTWQSGDFSCSGCHTEDPKKEGKQIKTKLPLKPLAPSANPERLIPIKWKPTSRRIAWISMKEIAPRTKKAISSPT